MENPEGGAGFVHEPLTQRERNVLAHLANNRSALEIAGLETLALSSVKWYIHQVYAKLGVNRRSEAITRATQLGLLQLSAAVSTSLPVEKNNLPRQLTSFIGREAEIARLLGLVQQQPLVTLTGSGGTGKTRLVLQVAERALPFFEEGVWFVDLAPISEAGLVAQAAATGLGMRVIPQTDITPTLCQFIGKKHLLLILDNCEHLIGAAAELARQLLHRCPDLHILATSREVLGVRGESTLRCPPLSMPAPQTQPTFAELAQSEAVRLFCERAQVVSPDFILTEHNAAWVARVCRRVDGIPLAIELAAARTRLLSMEQIAARLDDIFRLLTGGGRLALPRHQTLKALVDWSYDLLSAPERRLLCRLSVFAGGWTLEAAETVCAGMLNGENLAGEEILDLLGQLVDKSLVSVRVDQNTSAAQPRYYLLEMIRQYAHHRLLEGGGDDALRERHLDYFLAQGLEAELHLRARGAREWRDRLETEIDNLRLAFEWSLCGPIEKGLRLAAALQWFWHGTRFRGEGVGWLNRLLAAEASGNLAPPANPEIALTRKIARGKALIASSYTGRMLGLDGAELAAEAVLIFETSGEVYAVELAYSYYLSKQKSPQECLALFRNHAAIFYSITEMLGFSTQVARWNGELAEARNYLMERLPLCQAAGDQYSMGFVNLELGLQEFLAGNMRLAREYFQACQACFIEAGIDEIYPIGYHFFAWMELVEGDVQQAVNFSQTQMAAAGQHFITWMMSDALGMLAWEALTCGDENLAIQYGEQALKLVERPSQDMLATARYVLARVSLARGEVARARAFLQDFVQNNYYSWPPVQLGIQLFGILAARQMAAQPEQARRAATLFGAQAGMQAYLMNVIPQAERAACTEAITAVRGALTAEAFETAFAAGQAMTTREAIQYALDEDSSFT